MNRRTFDIAFLNAELKAAIAITRFEQKFKPEQKKEKPNATTQNNSTPNHPAEAQRQYSTRR